MTIMLFIMRPQRGIFILVAMLAVLMRFLVLASVCDPRLGSIILPLVGAGGICNSGRYTFKRRRLSWRRPVCRRRFASFCARRRLVPFRVDRRAADNGRMLVCCRSSWRRRGLRRQRLLRVLPMTYERGRTDDQTGGQQTSNERQRPSAPQQPALLVPEPAHACAALRLHVCKRFDGARRLRFGRIKTRRGECLVQVVLWRHVYLFWRGPARKVGRV